MFTSSRAAEPLTVIIIKLQNPPPPTPHVLVCLSIHRKNKTLILRSASLLTINGKWQSKLKEQTLIFKYLTEYEELANLKFSPAVRYHTSTWTAFCAYRKIN